MLLRTKGDVLDADISRHIDQHMSRVSASVSDDSVEFAAMTHAAIGARFTLV